jgi:hypothetical protein
LTGDETLSASIPDGSTKQQSSASEHISLRQAVTDTRHSTSKPHALAALHGTEKSDTQGKPAPNILVLWVVTGASPYIRAIGDLPFDSNAHCVLQNPETTVSGYGGNRTWKLCQPLLQLLNISCWLSQP